MENVLLVVLNTKMYNIVLYDKYTSRGLCMKNSVFSDCFHDHHLAEQPLLLVDFVMYQQCKILTMMICTNTNSIPSFYCNENHSSINKILCICQARLFLLCKYPLFDY